MATHSERQSAPGIRRRHRRLDGAVFLTLAIFGSPSLFHSSVHDSTLRGRPQVTVAAPVAHAVLWEPADIAHRDAFYGPGGEGHQPHGPYAFVKEDLSGSHPKFDVQDRQGRRWRVKLGTEARPETTATRLVWAVGYSADEDYFVDEIHVDGIPAHLHRGARFIDADGTMHGARLERESDGRTNIGEWAWRRNQFEGTRELNGLRVLMAVINNWDLKDANNSVYELKHRQADATEPVFEVSDLGSTFGGTGLERTDHANGSLKTYRQTPFITHTTANDVDFAAPRQADWIVLANVPEFWRRLQLRWIGRDIPRADARWMGELLSRLSPNQLHDMFRAAGYPPEDVEGFVAVLENRIKQLTEL
jgi:hypothetical protein